MPGRPGGCRRVDHDLQAVGGDQLEGIVGQMDRSLRTRGRKRESTPGLLGPAGPRQGGAGAVRIEVGDGHHTEARGGPGLGQEHRAELAGSDQADGDGVAFSGALLQ